MRKTLTTAALLLAFSCPALAGEIHTPGAPEPPKDNTVQEPNTAGEVTTVAADALPQFVLALLASLLP